MSGTPTAEDAFREAVQAHLKRLTAAGVAHEAAIDLLLASVRGGQGQRISETEVAQLVNAHGFSPQDALRALTVREEVRCLKAQGMSGSDAVRVLITRLHAAQPPVAAPQQRTTTAAPLAQAQLPQQQQHMVPQPSIEQQSDLQRTQVPLLPILTEPAVHMPAHSPKRLSEHRHSNSNYNAGSHRRKRADYEHARHHGSDGMECCDDVPASVKRARRSDEHAHQLQQLQQQHQHAHAHEQHQLQLQQQCMHAQGLTQQQPHTHQQQCASSGANPTSISSCKRPWPGADDANTAAASQQQQQQQQQPFAMRQNSMTNSNTNAYTHTSGAHAHAASSGRDMHKRPRLS